MDFGLDDGLESDDSFFEEPKILSKKPSLTRGDRKSVEDIFKFGSDEAGKKEEISKPVEEKKHIVKFDEESTKKATKDDDWLGVGSLEKPKKEKKTDFLEDILGSGPSSLKTEKKVTSFEDILKDSKVSSGVNPKPAIATLPQKEESRPIVGLLSETTSREKRRPRTPGAVVDDVLGLFSSDYGSVDISTKSKSDTAVKQQEITTKVTKSKETDSIPDWLGGTSTTKSETTISSVKPEKSSTTISSTESGIQRDVSKDKLSEKTDSNTHETKSEASLKSSNPLDFQSSYSALQQQESFLLVSMQLKKYEENLSEIKEQQNEILAKQEKQFEDLIGKYLEKQQLVESSIIMQQERINNHIKMLISEPRRMVESKNDEDNESSEVAAVVKNLQQRHNEEFFLMEESYKKQISLLENSSAALEERLNTELSNITKSFETKIESIQIEHKTEIEYYKEKIKTLSDQHKQDIELLKLDQNRVIEDLKEGHQTQIEYVKQSNNFENSLRQDASSYSAKLDANIEAIANNGKVLTDLQDKILGEYGVLSAARESSMETKEKEISMMRVSLERCREMAEKERGQLMALVRTLETKLAEQTENAREDRWALQQAAATLAARTAALDREAEFNRNSVEREREQLKTLKEGLLAEQEKLLLQITEEKLQLQAEKSRFQVSSKLSTNYEVEKMKTEAETSIQVAQELATKITQEREHLIRQKMEVDGLRRKLLERERELIDREEQLEYLTRNVQEKINEDKKAIFEAKNTENKYKERLRELQGQVASLTNREKKLAEEKLLLSKERLALFTAMKQGHKRCILCKTEDDSNVKGHEIIAQSNLQDFDMVRLRVEALEDDKNSEVSKEESQIL